MTTPYDAIGGRDAIRIAVDRFYERVLADPTLAPWFAATDMDRLRAHQRAFFTTALGGPDEYAGRSVGVAHAGLRITDAAFDRVAEHLTATLLDLGVPAETVEAVVGGVAGMRSDVVTVGASPS
jgi:hemoglobin